MRPGISFTAVREYNSFRVTGQFLDQSGVGFLPDTLTVRLYDWETGDIINGREDQSLLNVNGGTVDVDGNFVWTMSPEDNAIVVESPQRTVQIRRALLVWTWDDETGRADFEIEFRVKNTRYVPA